MRQDVFVGLELPTPTVEPISRRTLALFAGASGDHQPTHIDIDAAKAKGRDDVIAHGMLIMAWMGRILTDFAPQERLRSFETRFVSFTPVHAAPAFSARVTAIEGATARIELTASLEDGSVVATGSARIDIGE
jgi:acyl dehydratase